MATEQTLVDAVEAGEDTLLAALGSSLIAYEAIHFREARRRVRAAAHAK